MSAPPPSLEHTVEWTPVVTAEPPTGVEAGTLLGAGAHSAADLAGEGAVAIARPGGRVEVRASRDGVPSLVPEGVTVAARHEMEGNVDREVGDRAVRGSLRVGGHIAPGHELTATGPIRVEGNVDRSEVRAGGELQVEGRAAGAGLVGGSLASLRRQLHAPLGGMAQEIDHLVLVAGQLLDAAARRGSPATPALAIRALCAQRFDDLGPRLADGRRLLATARRSWPGLCAGLAGELTAAHQAIADPERADDPLVRLTAAAGFLAAAIPSRCPVTEVGVRLPAAGNCTIQTAGPLRLLGSGATDCQIDVGGDLIAMGTGGAVRGGEARVGGRVRARELSGREGASLRVVLEDTRPSDDVLRADVVNAGVEVVVGAEVLRFDRKLTDVRIGVRAGRPVLQAA